MKRITLLAAFLLAASACTNTPPDNTNTASVNTNATTNATTNMTANANTTASPATGTGGDVSSNIISQEKQVYDAIKSKNSDGFGAMLADDFILVVDNGIHNKAETVKYVQGFDVTDTTLADWKVLMLDKDAAVVYYNETMKGTSNGQPMPTTPFRASTAWVNRNGKWVAVFHQESETKPPSPPPPSANNKPATKASPGGMETMPMACTNDDGVAREKMVWDDLKKKDTNGFANYLADDAIEIEPDGVYDKDGSVNMVSQFDFSKMVLSDFKVVKLDSDAQLVTYLVKGNIPGMGSVNERHSTIWVKNNGSWQAKFHQGTSLTSTAATPAKK